jgi:thioredoxin reductase (NADPH)
VCGLSAYLGSRFQWLMTPSCGRSRAPRELEEEEEFDTVLVATGRVADTAGLNLQAVGLSTTRLGKIPAESEATAAPHVFVIGDAASEAPSSRPELTPVAIQSGKMLARRLYGGASGAFDNRLIPTTVFSPLEYGAVGMSEEEALEAFGADRLEIYHTHYTPLEWALGERPTGVCFCKVICDLQDEERILGLHVCGERAAEIVQGFAVAIRRGATKADLDATTGIHPCDAEQLVGLKLKVTKRSGESSEVSGC